ncbi:uncharacterized protein LOC104888284 isoform X2 [Beta vulgaris subsp. vulgaris]|uniref:uncharacterized protein LOC104888284 isoform X2 n=1 Tax=Beta vulgaris subsp. vulgaris TaxID=3555 RepID=UPI00054020B9|nr:uncharacterized protein LOC104888284 isoform X2 [Beta vulgaris subsp. vulgaris]
MDSHSERVQLNSFHPNGLVPKGVSAVTRPLEPGRWAIAEERTAELISQIRPNWTSEKHRDDVASYVQRLIGKCVPCQVFTFGSVPLKTYLPDGDIDLTAFSEDHNVKDNWANSVLDMLRKEEQNEHAEFQVKEVQYIQAEVKIIKCLVDNIVVDISFNQLGGLCTLCFLEEVDNLINHNHLFKRSIILIKAWCYYESRILGAHHGLISTYALETLVLYIFHVFDNSFAGPLEVLYRFMEFFSKFDWANFCVSLWGPVPICSLPSMAADPPRKDGAELLLDKVFLNACSTAYSVFPVGQDNLEQPFISKHFNVVDPLRINNNLGRSVSKGNFYRIRSAFSFGAQQLGRILECQEEKIVAEVNRFFLNTWDRHGKGLRPDAPTLDTIYLRQVDSKHDGDCRNREVTASVTENFISQHPQIDESHIIQPTTIPFNQVAAAIDMHKDLHSPRQEDYEEESRTQMSSGRDQYYTQKKIPTKKQQNEREKLCRADILQKRGHPIPQFARTSSSPELTSMSSEAASPRRHNVATERVKEATCSRFEYHRRTKGSGVMKNHVVNCFTNEPRTREGSSDLSRCAPHSSHPSDCHAFKPVSSSTKSVISSCDEPSQRLVEGQDYMNPMSSSGVQKYGVHVKMPVNVASHPFVSIPSSIPGYRPQNYVGTMASNVSVLQSDWVNVMHHSNGPSLAPSYWKVNSVGVRHEEEITEGLNDGAVSLEVDHRDDDHSFWTDGNADSMREVDLESGEFSTASSRLSPASPASSYRTKASSESSWDGKPSKINNAVRCAVTKKSSSSKFSPVGNNKRLDDGGPLDHPYEDVDDNSAAPSTAFTHAEVHQLPGFAQDCTNYPNSGLPFSPLMVRPGFQQGVSHSNAVLPFAFFPAGPGVPFFAMVPLYNMSAESRNSGKPDSHDDTEMEKPTFPTTHSSHSFSAKGIEQLSHSNSIGSTKRIMSEKHTDEFGPDIFNGDFDSHWINLQYGRLCQNLQVQHPFIHPPSIFIPPLHVQGNTPFEAPRSPYPQSSNNFTHPVPVSAEQPLSSKPAGVSRQYGGELPKHRNGTGTYFPNPVLKDCHISTSRQYQGDSKNRNEYHGEREANWNYSSKPRFAGRAQPRYRYDKRNSKMDPSVATSSQTDRACDTFRNKSSQLNRSPKDPSSWRPTWNGHYDADYPVYQIHSEYHNQVSQSGDALPPFVMLYPYPQTIAYGSQVEPLQFGSVGPEHFEGTDEVQQLSGYTKGYDLELQNYQGDTGPPSPDCASSPRFLCDEGI